MEGLLHSKLLANKPLQVLFLICAGSFVFMFYSFSSSNDFITESRAFYNADSKSQNSNKDLTFQEKRAQAAKKQAKQHSDEYHRDFHLLFLFTRVNDHPKLKYKLETCLGSMFKFANFNNESEVLHLHFVCDDSGRSHVEEYLRHHVSHPDFPLKVHFHDVGRITSDLRGKIDRIQTVLGHGNPYYDNIIFLLSLSLHRILPEKIHRLVQLDLDLKFTTNVRELWGEFNYFKRGNLIGIAHENQPVYRHILWKYRSDNPGTKVGGAPPDGHPGYNSGVLLLHLDNMRLSGLYNSYLEPARLETLVQKYSFNGHLGDQDFFTLLSFDHPELFHTLHCTWNKQLCTWWRSKGYETVFEQYFACHGDVKIWHGNCDSPLPE